MKIKDGIGGVGERKGEREREMIHCLMNITKRGYFDCQDHYLRLMQISAKYCCCSKTLLLFNCMSLVLVDDTQETLSRLRHST